MSPPGGRIAPRDHEEQIFETGAGIPIDELYGPDAITGFDPGRDLGLPGEYPYTRGPYAGMYRSRIWTRRFQVGFGSPEETNERIKYLAANGANGFVITIDLPPLRARKEDIPALVQHFTSS